MSKHVESQFPSENLISEIRQVFAWVSDVLSVYVFGSAAEGLLREKSDIDIAVRLRHNLSPIEMNNIRLKQIDVLEAVFQRKVDVTILNRVSLKMVHQVFKHGIQVYVKNPIEDRDFKLRKQKEYFDFQYYIDKERHELRLFYGC